ncbi:MAG: hypothetical protein HC763_17855 [Hydrococcus sp. CRU_1_1]|nr:hypothetical protein [Hydrococcus sp. CRU_1_1]
MKGSKASSQTVKPYGSLEANAKEEASLPVSTDLLKAEIVVSGDEEGDDLVQLKISNATTAVDRKLWALLLFLVWEDLEKKVGINEWHEMPMDEVQRYLRGFLARRMLNVSGNRPCVLLVLLLLVITR